MIALLLSPFVLVFRWIFLRRCVGTCRASVVDEELLHGVLLFGQLHTVRDKNWCGDAALSANSGIVGAIGSRGQTRRGERRTSDGVVSGRHRTERLRARTARGLLARLRVGVSPSIRVQ